MITARRHDPETEVDAPDKLRPRRMLNEKQVLGDRAGRPHHALPDGEGRPVS